MPGSEPVGTFQSILPFVKGIVELGAGEHGAPVTVTYLAQKLGLYQTLVTTRN